MNIPPQAPQDAMPSPPGAVAKHTWRFPLGICVGGIGSILLLAWIVYPAVQRQRIQADMMEATSNLRSISFALFEFESGYGAFPNEKTSLDVPASTSTLLSFQTRTSNDFFKQLIVAEICHSEMLFFASIPGAHKPDNVFTTDSTALAKGEVGFSYIVGPSRTKHPKRPLVVTPLIPGTNRFDPKPFNGKAIVLCADLAGSRSGPVLPIHENGEVIDSSGKHILDPANPIWGGEVPVIAWPK